MSVLAKLLKFLYSGISDLSSPEVEVFEIGQPLQVRQSASVILVWIKIRAVRFGQPFQMNQPGTGQLRIAEFERGEFGQPARVSASPASVI